jgi:hypothetical protein
MPGGLLFGPWEFGCAAHAAIASSGGLREPPRRMEPAARAIFPPLANAPDSLKR